MENNLTEEHVKTENNKVIDEAIAKVENKNYKIYFYCPAMNSPSGGIGVIFRQAKILKDAGYTPIVIYEPRNDTKASYLASQKKSNKVEIFEKFNPLWIGKDLEGITIQPLGKGTVHFNDGTQIKVNDFVVNPEDMVIIPEGFPNVMEKFASIPCKKIVLAQSWYYILNSMPVNQIWQNFGIKDVITVSDGITEYLNVIMPGLSIKQYSQSIDRNLFVPKPIHAKFPKIAFMPGRSQEAVIKTYNVIKTFYCFYPQFRWIRFDKLEGLPKEEFAERLAESAFVLYTDEIAGFGTMPLEAMACNTHVMGWTPIGGKEYMNAQNGFWAHNGEIFQLAELMGIAIERYLTGLMDNEGIAVEYEKTLKRYTPDNESSSILTIYKQYTDERIAEFQKLKQQ